MVTHRTLEELDDAQEGERRRARMRIETAERYVNDYRSRVQEVQENFHAFAAREGVAEDPGFREQLRRADAIVHENVAHAGRKVAELDEEYDQLLRNQSDERERYLSQAADD